MHTRAKLALAVATIALLSTLTAGSAAAAVVTTHLFAQAGPVTMHADLTLAGAHPAVSGRLSSCVMQPAPTTHPRSGIPDKLICTGPNGQKVVMPASAATATLAYRLHNSSSHTALRSMTVQIRHNGNVLFVLTARTGTLAIPLSHVAALLNGHDMLYVQAGRHIHQAAIVQTG